MTHEQKPESAEFRAREDLLPCPFCGAVAEQLDFDDGENIGGSCISCTRCGASGHVEFGFKENFVSQWNTRINNAAEQRRKDAEGCIPVHQFFMDGIWTDCSPKVCANQPCRRILYTRPANVAALEARVKELEKELRLRRDRYAALCLEMEQTESLLARIYEGNIHMKGQVDALVNQMAAIREGGV